MIKNKAITGFTIAGGLAFIAVSFVGAQAAALTSSCGGVVTGSSIQWTATAAGGTSPYSYLWSGTGIGGSTSSVVTATYTAAGTFNASVNITDASSSVASSTCSATVSASVTPPPPPATSTRPFFKKPDLTINPSGNFNAHGMIVQSISGNSFVATVWGTTWTVNLSAANGHFFLRGDDKERGAIDISQLKVGDEVGVSGKIDPNAALTVNGRVVRNYTINALRPHKEDSDNEGHENGKGNENGSSTQGLKDKLQQMLQQLLQLQGKSHGHGGDQ